MNDLTREPWWVPFNSTTGPTYTDVDIDPYEDPLSQPHDSTISPLVALAVLLLVLATGFLIWGAS